MRRLIIFAFLLVLLTSCAGPSRFTNQSRMGREASAAINACVNPDENGFQPGPKFPGDLRDKISSEFRALDGKDREVPLALNQEVKDGIKFFSTDARRFMVHALGRSTRYLPMMQSILQEKGLPPDLVYMVLIESGFRTNAVSPARAVGPWQFIAATGRRYGLQIDEFVDERMDPVKSTYAAAAYLKDLHDMFGCWYLAAAGYNAGEGTILKGLKRAKATEFWEIAQTNYIRPETKDYVPKFLAAAIIAKEPERYGICDIKYERPETWDMITVAGPTDLEVVAQLAGVDLETIQELNPHLKLWCTPLNRKDYQLRLPKGTGLIFSTRYANLPADRRMKLSIHEVGPGENLKAIAGVYGISYKTLQKFNNLKSTRLKIGQKIKLPVDAASFQAKRKEYQARLAAERQRLKNTGQKVVYVVRPGDSPWLIARNYDIHWKDIAEWNNIKDVRSLRPGQKLVLYLGPEPPPSPVSPRVPETKTAAREPSRAKPAPAPASEAGPAPAVYKVRDGDTLWKISMRFKVKPEELRTLNNLKDNTIAPGQVLKIVQADYTPDEGPAIRPAAQVSPDEDRPEEAVKPAPESGSASTYTVQKDDTLWKISMRFKVSPEEIRAANNMGNNDIRPGDVLKIPGPGAQESRPAEQASNREENPGQKLSYTVKDGDTLWKIARLFKVNPDQIRSWNRLNGDSIKPGDVLQIIADQG